MEIKKFEKYTDDELKELLFFWFKYYGKKCFTLEELGKFSEMIDAQPKAMFRTAAILYKNGIGPTSVLDGIRGELAVMEKCLNELKRTKPSNMDEYNTSFIKEVVNSYNNPAPAVPQDEMNMIEQVLKLIGASPTDDIDILHVSGSNSINISDLIKIMRDVSFKDEEIIDGAPIKNYVSVKLFDETIALCAERLEKHQTEIESMVDKLLPFTRPRSFNELGVTRNGETWAFNKKQIDALLTLAVGSNILSISDVKDGIPYFTRNKDKEKRLVGTSPEKFPCFKHFFEQQRNKKLGFNDLIKCTKETISKEAKKTLELLGFRLEIKGSKAFFYRLSDNKTFPAEISLNHKEMTFKVELDGLYLKYSLDLAKKEGNNNLLTTEFICYDTLTDYDGEYFEIAFGNDENNPSEMYSMMIVYANPELDQKVYRYSVSKDQIQAAIESELNSSEEGVGTIRYMYFTDPISDEGCPCVLNLNESFGKDELYSLSIDRTGKKTFDHTLNIESERDKSRNRESNEEITSPSFAKDLAVNYLKTSRVKNLYNRVIEVLDNAYPGLKSLINENHPFSSYVEEIMKVEPDKKYEDLMNGYAIKEANVPNENKKGYKKRRNVK